MRLTGEQRAWYLKWLYAKPQSESLQERERLNFVREFHVLSAFDLLSEIEAWPANAAEPGELVMQRWFRLFYLKMQSRGEVR